MQKICTLMDEVFNPDGSMKACGREKCKELIDEANRLFPDENWGDEFNRINVSAMLELRDKLNN